MIGLKRTIFIGSVRDPVWAYGTQSEGAPSVLLNLFNQPPPPGDPRRPAQLAQSALLAMLSRGREWDVYERNLVKQLLQLFAAGSPLTFKKLLKELTPKKDKPGRPKKQSFRGWSTRGEMQPSIIGMNIDAWIEQGLSQAEARKKAASQFNKGIKSIEAIHLSYQKERDKINSNCLLKKTKLR